jgi:large subunit ribosomal protein L44e
MVHMAKTRRTFCQTCQQHTMCKVTQTKQGAERSASQGRRRYDKKQKGFGGQTKPIMRDATKAKTTKRPVLKFTCEVCGHSSLRALKRTSTVQVGHKGRCQCASKTLLF